MWFDVTLSIAEGTVEDGQVLQVAPGATVIPEACANIAYSIVSTKRDAFRDVPIICVCVCDKFVGTCTVPR